MATSASAIFVFLCTLCYGVSLLGNGDYASVLGAPTVCMVVGTSRALFLLLLCAVTSPSAPPLSFSPHTLFPVLVVLVGNMGLYFFSLLREAPGEGGAVLCGMVSLYACIPVLWGVCLRSEAVRPLKLLGVALSLSATLLLGLSSGGGLGGGGGGGSALLVGAGAARRVALFLAAITCWGLCDVGSARLGRDTPFAHTALLGAIGQAVFGCAFALGSAAGGRGAPAGADAAAAPAAAVLWLSLANVAGVVGWLAFILAGRGGEVSALAPLTSLYVFLPVLVSTARGEVLTRGQAAGMGLAAVGAVLVGWGWGAAATAAPPPPPPPPPPSPHHPPLSLRPVVAVPDGEAGRREWEEGRRAPTPRAGGTATPRQRGTATPLLQPPPCVSGHL